MNQCPGTHRGLKVLEVVHDKASKICLGVLKLVGTDGAERLFGAFITKEAGVPTRELRLRCGSVGVDVVEESGGVEVFTRKVAEQP